MMLEFTLANKQKKISVDPEHIGAVVERGKNVVGIRIDHPEVIVVEGDYEHVQRLVNNAKVRNIKMRAGLTYT